MRLLRPTVPAVVLVALAACGGGSRSDGPKPGPGPGPITQPTITITTAGVSPKELTVAQGARVLFVNNDTRRRNMTSDAHPEHSDCPEINDVGLLNPGQSKETGNLTTVRTCGFHDHDAPGDASVKGRIIIR